MNNNQIKSYNLEDVEAVAAAQSVPPLPNMNSQHPRVDANGRGIPSQPSHMFVKKLIPFPPTGNDDDFSYKMDLREAERARAEELKYQLACDLRDIQLKSKTFEETNFDDNLAKYSESPLLSSCPGTI